MLEVIFIIHLWFLISWEKLKVSWLFTRKTIVNTLKMLWVPAKKILLFAHKRALYWHNKAGCQCLSDPVLAWAGLYLFVKLSGCQVTCAWPASAEGLWMSSEVVWPNEEVTTQDMSFLSVQLRQVVVPLPNGLCIYEGNTLAIVSRKKISASWSSHKTTQTIDDNV